GSAATDERAPGAALEAEEIDLSSFASLLRDGTNVLAIHALNRSADDTELLVLPELIAGRSLTNRFFPTPTPGAANDAGVRGFVEETQVSSGRGFFFAPFD